MTAPMRLHNETGDDFRVSAYAWHNVLGLARGHGWDPMDTEQPPENYVPHEGYAVARKDAAALADALERALDALPEGEFLVRRNMVDPLDYELDDGDIQTFRMVGFDEGDLRRFIRFCRGGGFAIL